MDELRIDCRGVELPWFEGSQVPAFVVPAFQARIGDFLCIHWPMAHETEAEKQFIDMLTGMVSHPALDVREPGIFAPPAPRDGPNGEPVLPLDYLMNSTGMSGSDAMCLLEAFNIPPTLWTRHMKAYRRMQLGVEAAWPRSKVVVFNCGNLERCSRYLVFRNVPAHLADGTAIHISYPVSTGWHCYPETSHVEVDIRT